MIEKGKWTDCYYQWATQKGVPIRVKPLRYIGIQSVKENYAKRREHEGILYAAELWECIDENGDIIKGAFRIPLDEIGKDFKASRIEFKIENEVNAHSDGYDAYITNKRNNVNNLIIKRTNELRQNIKLLTQFFKELNNFENADLKIGIQIYLQRLQTPCLQTVKEWKLYGKKHPYMKEKIINILSEKKREYSHMI